MRCPFCGNIDTIVSDSRLWEDGESIKRRRSCPSCGAKFNTVERVIKKEITVIKKDGGRVLFEKEKIFNSIFVSSGKRLTKQQVEEITKLVSNRIENSGLSQIKTSLIAEIIMDNLERFDIIAYVRFASVYMDFESVEDINNFVKSLNK